MTNTTTAPAFHIDPLAIIGESLPGQGTREWEARLDGEVIATGRVGELEGIGWYTIRTPFEWKQDGFASAAEAWDALGTYMWGLVSR